jgi:hypothetical protein
MSSREKQIEKAKKENKVEILALDIEGEGDILYYTNDVTIEGAFIKFIPRHCFAERKFFKMAEMTVILPNTRVKQIIVRK